MYVDIIYWLTGGLPATWRAGLIISFTDVCAGVRVRVCVWRACHADEPERYTRARLELALRHG